MSRLIWNGDAVLTKIRAAETRASESTAEAAAEAARHTHRWRNRTGAGEQSIHAVAPRTSGASVLGAVGFAIRPVLFQDRGFRSHPGDRAIERAAKSEMRKLIDRLRAAIH